MSRTQPLSESEGGHEANRSVTRARTRAGHSVAAGARVAGKIEIIGENAAIWPGAFEVEGPCVAAKSVRALYRRHVGDLGGVSGAGNDGQAKSKSKGVKKKRTLDAASDTGALWCILYSHMTRAHAPVVDTILMPAGVHKGAPCPPRL